MTTRSHSSGFAASRRKPRGPLSSSRWIVFASAPVLSASRLAARPVGAASAGSMPRARTISRNARTRVVLPTPGPPVRTADLGAEQRRRARGAGSRRASTPRRASAHGTALAASIARHGRLAAAQPIEPLRDRALGLPQPAQEHARFAVDGVEREVAGLELRGERRFEHVGWNVEQRGGALEQPLARQRAVSLVGGFEQHPGEAGARALRRRARDPELHRDLVGDLEADAADVARQAVGIGGDQRHRVGSVGLPDPHRARGGDAVRLQEDHDLADRLLVRPAGGDALARAADRCPPPRAAVPASARSTSKTASPNAATSRLA